MALRGGPRLGTWAWGNGWNAQGSDKHGAENKANGRRDTTTMKLQKSGQKVWIFFRAYRVTVNISTEYRVYYCLQPSRSQSHQEQGERRMHTRVTPYARLGWGWRWRVIIVVRSLVVDQHTGFHPCDLCVLVEHAQHVAVAVVVVVLIVGHAFEFAGRIAGTNAGTICSERRFGGPLAEVGLGTGLVVVPGDDSAIGGIGRANGGGRYHRLEPCKRSIFVHGSLVLALVRIDSGCVAGFDQLQQQRSSA